MSNSLFHDVRAFVDARAASSSDVRVRGLVSIGQVMQHVVNSSAASYVEPQGCGDPGMHGTSPCEIGSFVPMSGGMTNAPEPYEYDEPEGGTWLKDEYGIPYWTSSGDVVEAVAASGPVVCDIAADEAAEQDAALRSYLRSLNMGTWLSAMPRRFPPSAAYRGSSR
jgi:hypothetical protein